MDRDTEPSRTDQLQAPRAVLACRQAPRVAGNNIKLEIRQSG